MQGTAQTAQINRLRTALSVGGGGRRDNGVRDRNRDRRGVHDCNHDNGRDRENGRGHAHDGRRGYDGRRERGRRQDDDDHPFLNYCANCERTLGRKPDDCYHATRRPPWWNKEKHEIRR